MTLKTLKIILAMKRLLLFALLFVNVSYASYAADASDVFEGAEWIALEADSTILFPYIHLLKPKSEEARSLKTYTMPRLTKHVNLDNKEVSSARVAICGLGQYDLAINHQPVGDYFLSPGWTMYDKTLLYNTYDVTEQVRNGEGLHISVMLGNGMYNIPVQGYHKMAGSCGAPKMIFALDIDYTDGGHQRVVSDGSWFASPSPIRYSSIYAGEWHDATVGAEVNNAVVTAPHWPAALVEQQPGTKVKIRSEYPAKHIGNNIYDTGHNLSGIVRIKVRGERGKNIRLYPAEILSDGAVNQRCAPGYEWRYTLYGNPEGDEWQPQFTYAGFRYVGVEADPGVEILEITGLHTTTDAPEVGSFECSDSLFNAIHSLIDAAIRSNLVSITTDCPTREKLGWQEQNHLMAHSLMYRYDMRALMNKIADDLAASQHDTGAIPTIAPEYTPFAPGSGFEDTPEWGASFILCPWYTYLWYGDDSAMRRHYPAMARYIDYLSSRAEGGIIDYGLGDWFDIGPERPGKAQLTAVALSATAVYYDELNVMAEIARHLGFDADADKYARMAAEVKKAFNERFYVGAPKVYERGSQTGLAMALYTGLADGTEALDALVANIKDNNYALTAGDVGFRYVVQALTRNGRDDIIYAMNSNDSIPGYGYQLRKGATALTESWQAYDNVSNNHLMLGHLMEWLYGGLGGIRQAPGSVAWKNIVVDPRMVGDIDWANTSLRTPGGIASCRWQRKGDEWAVEGSIPAGSEADVHLPDGRIKHIGSGDYKFESPRVLRIANPVVTEGADSIYGLLSLPADGADKHGIVIACHGFNGTHDAGRPYFEPYNEKGYAVYCFDFPSLSARSRTNPNTLEMSVPDQVKALEAVVEYFRAQPYVDKSRIVVQGESQGGLVAALAAAELKSALSAIVLIYPAFCIPDDWNGRYPDVDAIPDVTKIWNVPVGRRFFLELRDLDPYKVIADYAGQVLIIHGTDDKIVPISYSNRADDVYAARLGADDSYMVTIPGAGHGFNPDQFATALENILPVLK